MNDCMYDEDSGDHVFQMAHNLKIKRFAEGSVVYHKPRGWYPESTWHEERTL